MDLTLSDDQRAILDSLDMLLRAYEAPPADAPLCATNPQLDSELAEAGFLDVASDPDLGTLTAALVVERLARLPVAVETAASALVGPLLGEDTSRPVCLVEARRPHRPIRFLRDDATIILLEEDSVTRFTASAGQIRAEPETLFAYPVATLTQLPDKREALSVAPDTLRARWQVALAAESAGLLAAALGSTVAHVTDREQFGRPIATFQTIRHRLAEAQVRINGVYWLAMKAASDCDPAGAAMAALHAQQSARECVYDFHQFLGAMGMTLEHPLHLWTYRLKLLIGELGGPACQARTVADRLWGPSPR